MEEVDGITIRKKGILHWEAEVPSPNGRGIYFFPAYTKNGALKLAQEFLKEQKA